MLAQGTKKERLQMRRRATVVYFVGSLIVGLIVSISAQSQGSSGLPSDQAIRQILVQRVDDYRQAVGIVVGVIDAQGRRIVTYGAPAKNDPRPLNGESVFEIGSITKAFTSLLLTTMAQRGEVTLADPVSKYLPESVRVPARGGRQITLLDLANHTSGLPNLPSNFKPTNPANPYAAYSIDQLYEFLTSYQVPRDIGSQYEYSNLGGGLLGNALARHAGKDYEALVRERITGPLRMNDTRIVVSDEMMPRLAQGHNARLEPVSNWDLPAFAGAGALRSTTDDMLTFLAVPLGYLDSPLKAAFDSMYSPRLSTGIGNVEIAVGWHITKTARGEIIWHNGGTGGYRSFAGYDLQARTGVVVLSNTSTSTGVDDIGMHLLDPAVPLAPAPKTHTQKSVDPKIFTGYVGRYQLTPARVLNIISDDHRLFAQAEGQNRFELFPEGDREFFAKIADIQIVFEVDASGRATALTLIQGASQVKAGRID
jgi:CubicO group peptidase (beta-lactamase class C family)